jgi:hypothetical protein
LITYRTWPFNISSGSATVPFFSMAESCEREKDAHFQNACHHGEGFGFSSRMIKGLSLIDDEQAAVPRSSDQRNHRRTTSSSHRHPQEQGPQSTATGVACERAPYPLSRCSRSAGVIAILPHSSSMDASMASKSHAFHDMTDQVFIPRRIPGSSLGADVLRLLLAT